MSTNLLESPDLLETAIDSAVDTSDNVETSHALDDNSAARHTGSEEPAVECGSKSVFCNALVTPFSSMYHLPMKN